MERSIQEVAKLTGTTSRTLRHYQEVGLLMPSRIGSNGTRYYDAEALTRLQRILLLRELGLGLAAIAEVMEGRKDHPEALAAHLEWLRGERVRLDERIDSVRKTFERLKKGEEPMAEEMFGGFDHTRHRDEVVERWGREAYESGDRWWRGMTGKDRRDWMRRTRELGEAWAAAAARGADPRGPEGEALARRHFEWLAGIPGTPRAGEGPSKAYFLGLAEMYVADERFAANYGGVEGATFVREAMRAFVETNL